MFSGSRDYIHSVNEDSLRYAENHARPRPAPVSYEYLRAAKRIMEENSVSHMPHTVNEGLSLFFTLVTAFDINLRTHQLTDAYIWRRDAALLTIPLSAQACTVPVLVQQE